MQSALIVYSRSNKKLALKIAKKYKDISLLEVASPPSPKTLKIKTNKDIVIGIGGGSVIDTAKIISGRKRSVAIPSTAAGAASTPYATVWTKSRKISVSTAKPILNFISGISKKLPPKIAKLTMLDAFSHAIESLWSVNANSISRKYSKRSLVLLMKYIKTKDKDLLIKAGNEAGKAIAITKTNVIHAASYPFTIGLNIAHGQACGLLLPYFVEYMDYKELPGVMGLTSTKEVVSLLKRYCGRAKMGSFNPEIIADKTLRYDRINHGPKKIKKAELVSILEKIKDKVSGKA